ncbi:MAG: hypothetical protein H0X24_24540 [Ktedonobacterales bacterium]|nr:hypothetical protein [Ktedonobacterales bacterium]
MKLLQGFGVSNDAATRGINPVAQVTQQLLLGNAVRENHALEHATIVLLSQQLPETRLAGVSIAAGFFIFGDVPTEKILPTAREALRRLRGDEPDLAIHERCGTNLAVAGLLTGLAAMSVTRLRKPYNTFNNVVLASTAALVVARPLGLLTQRFVTTHTPNASMTITGVHRFNWRGSTTHFVRTDNPKAAGIFG